MTRLALGQFILPSRGNRGLRGRSRWPRASTPPQLYEGPPSPSPPAPEFEFDFSPSAPVPPGCRVPNSRDPPYLHDLPWIPITDTQDPDCDPAYPHAAFWDFVQERQDRLCVSKK